MTRTRRTAEVVAAESASVNGQPITLIVERAQSRYGTPRPTLRVDFPETLGHRERNATIYRLAAIVEEMSTGLFASWVIDPSVNESTIGVELVEGSEQEESAALSFLVHAVLARVVGLTRPARRSRAAGRGL